MAEGTNRRKVVAVFGTRPDAIKMAPVVLELGRRSREFDLKVVVTGQHRNMLDQVIDVFGIAPDYDLAIMTPGQSLSEITTRVLERLDPVIGQERPEFVLAQGDTTTTFVAALAAFYHKSAFGHVEAGLRTGNSYDPFPEEMNRLLTTRLATLHFAPTEEAVANLVREAVSTDTIFLTGNTGIDALLMVANRDYDPKSKETADILSLPDPVMLVSSHRRENLGDPQTSICRGVRRLVAALPSLQVVFPMHPNPKVRETVLRELSGVDRVYLVEPLGYVEFVKLQQKAILILTDSGGVQEEAPSLGKPVLVLRNTTERPEGVDAGTAKLVGTAEESVFQEAFHLLTDPAAYQAMARAVSPYGDGKAAARIADALKSYATRSS